MSQWLLAELDPYAALQWYLQRPVDQRWPEFLGLLVFIVAAVWAGLFLGEWRRRWGMRLATAPLPACEQLVRAHGLSPVELSELTKLAIELGLSDPLPLFVDPRFLEVAAVKRVTLAAIGKRLFGEVWQPLDRRQTTQP